jgi:hypothetical protein
VVIAGIDRTLCYPVDHYCERLGTALTAEPINALTNLAFIVAGYAAWRLYQSRRNATPDPLLTALIVCVPVVGFGSMLFHTVATRWSEWGDVLPILIFMLLYLWLILRRWLGVSFRTSVLAEIIFLEVTYLLEARVPSSVLWGGAMYLPTVFILVTLGIVSLRRHSATGRTFLGAVGVFLASFGSRTIDAVMCPFLPMGTHFLWHLLNALLLFMLVKAAIQFRENHVGLIVHGGPMLPPKK